MTCLMYAKRVSCAPHTMELWAYGKYTRHESRKPTIKWVALRRSEWDFSFLFKLSMTTVHDHTSLPSISANTNVTLRQFDGDKQNSVFLKKITNQASTSPTSSPRYTPLWLSFTPSAIPRKNCFVRIFNGVFSKYHLNCNNSKFIEVGFAFIF